MREARLPLPELFLIAATRGMLGVGIGLLAADRVPHRHRRVVGTTLAAIGALSTIPLAIRMFRRQRTISTESKSSERVMH